MRDDARARIGPYEVVREIGRGGMGVVYLARDTTLDRDVAIKCLPSGLSSDPDRLARFEREARTLASLNHANVSTIHGLEMVDDERYLILEYVEGETLEDRLKLGRIPVDEAIDLAIQMSQAIEAAHERGIIHRDLKPANIKLAPGLDGATHVKVLDFGLAKAFDDRWGETSDLSESPTVAQGGSPTMPGMILGTAGYLSPEQARGQPVDKRTDVFSFGCILYEMLSGRPPFPGETVTDSIAATLNKRLDLTVLPPHVPPAVRRTIQRCLERDRRNRLHDIADARIELEGARDGSEDREPVAASSAHARRGPILAGMAIVALVAAAIGWAVGRHGKTSVQASPAIVAIPTPAGTQLRLTGDLGGPVAVSPDGSKLVFAAAAVDQPRRLWLRRLDEPDARELDGTDEGLFPFWSPDGRSVGFFTPEALRRLELASGTIQTVCAVNEGRGATWTDNGRIVFSPAFRAGLSIVDASGGRPEPLTTLDETRHTTHRWPVVLPDGKQFLFFATHRDLTRRQEQGIFIGTVDGSAPPRLLIACEAGGQYVDGWLLYPRDDRLLAVRVDLEGGRVTGEPRVLARDLAVDRTTWHAQFSASAAGTLAFNRRVSASGRARASALEAGRITVFDIDGSERTHFADGQPIADMSLSPDGHTLAISILSENGTLDLWLYPTTYSQDLGDLDEQERIAAAIMNPNPRRLTFLEGSESRAIWSPDGKQIAFARRDCPQELAGIYRQSIDGGREELLLTATDGGVYPDDWTRDGRYLVYVRGAWEPSASDDIWALALESGESIPLVVSPGEDWMARVSPDGRWLAFTSRRTGRNEVFVIPFAPAWPEEDRGRRWQVSLDGGVEPVWRPDGSELYYIADDQMVMSVLVTTGDETIAFGRPTALFQAPYDYGVQYGVYPPTDVTRFVFMNAREASDQPISVILGWQRLIGDGAVP